MAPAPRTTDPLEALRGQVDPFGIEAVNRGLSAPRPKAGHKPVYRRAWFWALVALVVLVVAVRIALNPLAARFTQQALDQLEDHRGKFESVRVSIFPLTYTIRELNVRQLEADPGRDPVLYVKKLTVRVPWRKLLSFQLVAVATVDEPKASLKLGLTEPPKPKGAKERAPKKPPEELDLGKTLSDIVPFRIDRFEVREGELDLIDATVAAAPVLWVKDIALVVENITSRRAMDEEAPLSLTMKALVSKTGVLTVLAHADLLAKKPAFTGQAQLTGLELSTLHEWTKVRAGVSAKGDVDVFANFNSAEGVLSGDVKVMLDGAKLEPATGQVDDLLKASFGQLAINVLGDSDKDNRIATTLPIRGELTDPSPQIWPTILGVVRNVLVEGVSWGFSDLPRPTAKEKRGPLKQATEALDPKENEPKAEPPK